MGQTLNERALKRELGYLPRAVNSHTSVRGFYGDKRWVEDLDIVNELDGHSGCVNALSWSRSGRLLASGSDDQHVNIHTYLPESSTSQFQFTTTIATGHRANIFSVKFMPHSNDRTVVTAAGDHEVRIFDIEYAGKSATSNVPPAYRASTRRNATSSNIFNGVQYLSEGDANAKVFRSHGDRVKRIVTESSPFFFLTCSEDGEVRQWDIRQPSSAYPPPGDGYLRRRSSSVSGNMPPALISYKNYGLDLNTISCSPSQPHYIALGGAHLHCFLHDRRMLGRDTQAERGASSPRIGEASDEITMNRATRCVKKFAPNGKRSMRQTDNGHITACKISDANPNELLVSWSKDWIYNFDINRTPDADTILEYTSVDNESANRIKQWNTLKRKRVQAGSSISNEAAYRAESRARTDSQDGNDESMALMVQYENGQSEEIPIESHSPSDRTQDDLLSDAEKLSHRIASITVKIRRNMFSLNACRPSKTDPIGHASSFTSVLGFSASILPDMDDLMRSWCYPVDPSSLEVEFQNELRAARGSARRLVQAAGTLARVLGGNLRMGGPSDSMMAKYFTNVVPVPNERTIPRHENFGYDFLKAILLWLDSGIGSLIEGFGPSKDLAASSSRCPLPRDAATEDVDEILIPYLLNLASDEPVLDVDSSRFEVAENRVLFASEKEAVNAFSQSLKIPFADLSSAVVSTSIDGGDGAARFSAQDRKTASKFWAMKVGRGILMNASKGVNFELVDRAFGGQGRGDGSIAREESALSRRLGLQDEDEDEDGSEVIHQATLISSNLRRDASRPDIYEESNDIAVPLEVLGEVVQAAGGDDEATGDGEESVDGGNISDSSDDEDNSDSEEDDIVRRLFYRSNLSRSMGKNKVETAVPCGTHTRIFKGHCNVKTVKDVNFYGLNDEYVVSGCDSGHLFVWDKKTSKILNILEGDGEVVNVVHGHPYEPMIAVSGIDHTVKIFSSDARSRYDARNGIGVTAADASDFSSINYYRSRRRNQSHPNNTSDAEQTGQSNVADLDSDDESHVARNGLASRRRIHQEYQITSENDNSRQGGGGEAYITRSMLERIARTLRDRQAAGETDINIPMLLTGAATEEGDCQMM